MLTYLKVQLKISSNTQQITHLYTNKRQEEGIKGDDDNKNDDDKSRAESVLNFRTRLSMAVTQLRRLVTLFTAEPRVHCHGNANGSCGG
jgi:hypothetical protein